VFYDIPLDPPLTDKLRWAAGYQYEDIDGSDTQSKLLTLGPDASSRAARSTSPRKGCWRVTTPMADWTQASPSMVS